MLVYMSAVFTKTAKKLLFMSKCCDSEYRRKPFDNISLQRYELFFNLQYC